jgi:hypothetical protein
VTQKLYCYVDETGIDVGSAVFIVAVIILADAICGLARAAAEEKQEFVALLRQGLEQGYIIRVE